MSSSSRSASSSVGSLPSLLRSTSSVASSPPTSPECEPDSKSGLSDSLAAATAFESTRDDSTTISEPFLDSASRSHLARARSPPAMDDSTSKDSLHSRVERLGLNGAERGDSESTKATAAAAGSSSSSPPRPTLATSTDSQSPVTPTATVSGTSRSPQVATPTGPTAAEATPESDSSISNPNPTRESDPTRLASSPPPVPSTQQPSMLSPSTTSTATNEASSEASTSAAPPLYPRQSAAPSSTINSASPPPATGATTAAGGAKKPIGSAALRQGVRGAVGTGTGPLKMPPSLAAKMAAMTSRKSVSPSGSPAPGGPPVSNGGVPRPNMQPSLPLRTPGGNAPAPALAPRPAPRPPQPGGGGGVAAGGGPISSGALAGRGGPGSGGMAGRRKGPGLTLSQMGISTTDDAPSSSSSSSSQQQQQPSPANGGATGLKRGLSARTGGMRLPGQVDRPSLNGSGRPGAMARGTPASPAEGQPQMGGSPFSNFRKIVDPSGRLNFASKAILHSDGVDFSSGASFKIKMDEFELYEELGKGNYGTVQKVLHKPTGVTMALKEIRLELDDSKLKTIITELDILHRATSLYIVDFYGAFFIESCVYYCMEFMDAGSLDFFAGCDLPEDVLARVTGSMVEGLKFLKDELKIMHRDVKPTNVLLNSKGQVKLCDFGVSGQLDRSLAKTNIGCQSYMAPERIKGESQGAPTSYTASSDVWSLGLSVIEAACGHYPYPPETYANVFAQLTAIVHGDPPTLPDNYSATAQDFVQQCLRKQAHTRPTYKELLAHPFLLDNATKDIDMVGWIARATEYRKTHPKINAPALA